MTIIAVVAQVFNLYCEDSDNPAFAHVWLWYTFLVIFYKGPWLTSIQRFSLSNLSQLPLRCTVWSGFIFKSEWYLGIVHYRPFLASGKSSASNWSFFFFSGNRFVIPFDIVSCYKAFLGTCTDSDRLPNFLWYDQIVPQSCATRLEQRFAKLTDLYWNVSLRHTTFPGIFLGSLYLKAYSRRQAATPTVHGPR